MSLLTAGAGRCVGADFDGDDQTPDGKSMRTTGIVVTAVGGGIGAAAASAGLIMSTCAGAFGDSLKRCQANATHVIIDGLAVLGVSAAIGVPLIVVGAVKMHHWKTDHAQSAQWQPSEPALAWSDPTPATSPRITYSVPLLRVLF